MYAALVPVEDIVKFIKEEEEIDNSQAVADSISKIIESMYWYDQEILKMYVELGSVRKVSKQTGIPHTSIFITIKNIRKCIKQQLLY
jgi:transposase-like protein